MIPRCRHRHPATIHWRRDTTMACLAAPRCAGSSRRGTSNTCWWTHPCPSTWSTSYTAHHPYRVCADTRPTLWAMRTHPHVCTNDVAHSPRSPRVVRPSQWATLCDSAHSRRTSLLCNPGNWSSRMPDRTCSRYRVYRSICPPCCEDTCSCHRRHRCPPGKQKNSSKNQQKLKNHCIIIFCTFN